MDNKDQNDNEVELQLLPKSKIHSDTRSQVFCMSSDGTQIPAVWDGRQGSYVCKVKRKDNNSSFEVGEEEFVRCRQTFTKEMIQTVESPFESSDKNLSSTEERGIFKSLSFIDRYLSVWIILAMIIGIMLGYFTNFSTVLDTTKIDTVSLPIAIGLWLMMWPVLCKVRYEILGDILGQKAVWGQIKISVVLNWLVGPLLMTILAWITLPDLPGYRNGLILVGVARCIAMVLIWNQLAKGDAEYCAILVAINSILQIVLYAPLALFYLKLFSSEQTAFGINFWDVCRSVMIFLGAPFIAGVLTRVIVIQTKGRSWFNEKFVPAISPIALIALIYTILILFTLQGNEVVQNFSHVLRVSVPMVLYFILMWIGTFFFVRSRKGDYEKVVTQAFTAASNNFELAIAVAVGTFGAKSQEALAATVGPLIEVPALLFLVHIALWLRHKLNWS